MITTGSLYERCQQLFREYPLAVDDDWEMALLLPTGTEAAFFILTKEEDGSYCVHRWHGGERGRVTSNEAGASAEMARVLKDGVPCPRDGEMFGWVQHGVITGLIATRTPQETGPEWSAMPVAGSPEGRWPLYVGRPLLGRWFWNAYQAGAIVDLAPLVASTPGTIYSADTVPTTGFISVVVTSDVRKGGITLPQGVYIYHAVLTGSGLRAEALESLARKAQQTDLAPRFKHYRNR
jgi:hypothetical protein